MMEEKTPQTDEKQQTERKKNKAEIFIVCLCWVCFFVAVLPLFMPKTINYLAYLGKQTDKYSCHGIVNHYLPPTVQEFFEVHNNASLLFVLCLIGLILLLHIFRAISKRKEYPIIRPKYYDLLLIFLWLILLELCLMVDCI